MPLRLVGEWGSGGTPSRKDPAAYGGGIPWLKISDLSDGLVGKPEETITSHGLEKSSAKLVPPGTLLVAMYGSIGKLGITSEDCSTNQAIAFCRPYPEFDINYLFYALMYGRSRLQGEGQGGTQLNISQTILKAFEIPIAPYAEQPRIVSKIDELFSRIDEGERALDRVRLLVERYRQSILKAAVTGELTRHWREKNRGKLESGEELLARILQARREAWEAAELEKMVAKGKPPADDKWKSKYKEPEAPDTSDLPELPEGWVWATPVQLQSPVPNALTIGPFGSNLKVVDYRSEGVPLIFVRNIRNREFFGTDSKFVSPKKAQELSSHSAAAGDVLITKMGDPPGDACVYPQNAPPAIITADCIKWTLSPILPSAEYVAAFINSAIGRRQMMEITTGVAQQKVSLGRFRRIAVALPNREEQVAISEAIELALTNAFNLQRTIAQQQQRSKTARQSILKASFTGQLLLDD